MSFVVRTEIDIDAPVSRIWEILVDLDRYEEWNPFIVRAKGRIRPGATFSVSPRTKIGKQVTYVPQVTDYHEGREFTWTGEFYHRLFALGDHSFCLIPLADGRIRLEHDERIYGVGAVLVWLIGKGQIRAGFEAMNLAVKRRAEESFD
jgi:hypothetical protein